MTGFAEQFSGDLKDALLEDLQSNRLKLAQSSLNCFIKILISARPRQPARAHASQSTASTETLA